MGSRWGQANLIDLVSHRPFCKLSQKVSTTPRSSGLLANSSASFLKPLLLKPLVLAVTPSPTLDSSNRLTFCPIRPIPGSPSQPLSHGSGATPQPAADRTVYRQSSLSRLSLSLSSRSGSRFSIPPKSPIEMQTPYQHQEITLVVTKNRFWLSLRQSK